MTNQTTETNPETPAARLAALGLELPEPARPSFDYVPAVRDGHILYVAGQLPKQDGEVRITGRCGEDVDLDTARTAAEICTLQGIACAAAEVGGINGITGVIRVTGFVASTPDFHQQPKIIDAASALLRSVFGERGRHARSAVGAAALPRRSPVEIEFIFTVADTAEPERVDQL
ncbi:enamine deaminase RidA (YjgF/YER057c/UK114 family) [Tamaricihabitans halophyticus]|uniref:Enamine deaminase RidA (YjgF/YER057c/UK114 family) n=1 Tax=Tamaricihabitans halophyticus TaxID=1262583 RepID=A0A4V2SRL3_9PSEU|nr:RidA family protein [Tamaricihabitans halophyticus]TCP43436.1 enamine deaminase RidA (YjgF/YER057c/UK114 family) [Tamaricihabitans halophyticus]